RDRRLPSRSERGAADQAGRTRHAAGAAAPDRRRAGRGHRGGRWSRGKDRSDDPREAGCGDADHPGALRQPAAQRIQDQAGEALMSKLPKTNIATSDAASITVRGRDLVDELIGRYSYTEVLYLLIKGRMPSAGETKVLDACLVTLMEHGL